MFILQLSLVVLTIKIGTLSSNIVPKKLLKNGKKHNTHFVISLMLRTIAKFDKIIIVAAPL